MALTEKQRDFLIRAHDRAIETLLKQALYRPGSVPDKMIADKITIRDYLVKTRPPGGLPWEEVT